MSLASLRRRFVVMIGSVVVIIVLLLNGSEILQIAADFNSPPPPVATLSPGTTPPPIAPSGDIPGQTPPPYIVTPPSLAGRVLHWTQHSYFYDTSSPDPAIGRLVIGDVWQQIGAYGLPNQVHGRYTFSDGSFYQEVVQTPDATMVILSVDPPANSPVKAPRCATVHRSSSTTARRGLLPPFVDLMILSRHGFSQRGGLTKQLPSTASLSGVKPLEIHGPDVGAQGWSLLQSDQRGRAYSKRLEIGAGGRLLVEEAQVTNSKGDVISERWTAYGPLETYDPASVPDTVFTATNYAPEVCHG